MGRLPRKRTDKAHVAADHVQHYGNSIHAGATQNPADSSNLRGVISRTAIAVRHYRGAETEHGEGPTIPSCPLLYAENRSAAVELNQDSHNGEDWRSERKENGG